ncbi:beta-D-glucuronidase [Haloferula helveola]|uniref:Beta-D-glucuronidase n=2 Tax=Haloferula helveola TaxID=490095 RepID=A0ABM7RFW5_9BACT|nr:beta-D-glucuronidase [Haloferula helveola]
MLTRWAKDIDPSMPLPEYPRPQMTRERWANLNGLWNYSVVPAGTDQPDAWEGKILVPFGIESSLSGVKRPFRPDEVLYYQRDLTIPEDWKGDRVILHFGAVDYLSEVFVNGRKVGGHEGGYTPFSFDITDFLTPSGEQDLVVKVTDPTRQGGQPRGKQTLNPAGIMYTPTSGIWQTAWLEPVAEGGIEDFRAVPDLKSGSVKVTVDLYGGEQGDLIVTCGGRSVRGKAGDTLTMPVPDAVLWTPENPHLYDMTIELSRGGRTVDAVDTYFGMRSIELAEVDGVQRLLLNGKPYFMFGPLDQGFWPDGVYTAPTDEALKFDLEVTKKLGFNTTRKHIKIEPARWYHHADKLGLLVWQDMPSANSYDAPNPHPAIEREAYETQLREMIDHLENCPSIVMWVVFNESQGKHDVVKLVKAVRKLDPTRLVNEDSGYQNHGGPFLGVGDVDDFHPYPAPRAFDYPDHVAFVLGEYGGIGLKTGDNNPWQKKGWGYTTTETAEELENLYAKYNGRLREFRDEKGLCAAIYTQLTDVEIEINGLLTYDRELKVDPEWIAKANRFEWFGPEFTGIVPTSRDVSQEYLVTFEKPAEGWMKPDADTGSWNARPGGFGTENTPGTGKIGTEWNGSDIWLRRSFTLPKLTEDQMKDLAIELYHDDDVEVYVNGVLALQREGYVTEYTPFRLPDDAKAALKPGEENLIAIHCRQSHGGQYVDFGLGVLDDGR